MLSPFRIFIIGGGPSLTGFDFERLRGHGAVMAVNGALKRIPWADYFFSGCPKWIKNGESELRRFKGQIYLASENRAPDGIECTILNKKNTVGFSKALPDIYMQGHSGFAALNLACLLGAKEIFLFGYDFYSENGKKHFHEGYPWEQPGPSVRYWPAWAKGFYSIVPYLEEHGINVLNFSPKSLVTTFMKHSLDDLEGVMSNV